MKFQKIYIEIGNICNLQCSFCPEVIRDKKRMSPIDFESIAKEVKKFTDTITFHLMGEPLSHPDFQQFIETCKKNDLQVELVTNGTLLRKEKFSFLLDPVFRQINFSMHSFFNNFPSKDPSNYLENIFSFTEIALEKRSELYLNYRLWNLLDQKSDQKRNQEMLSHVEKRFQWEAPTEVELKRKKGYRVQGRLYVHFDSEFIWPSLDLPVLQEKGTCYGLKSHLGILADGTVVPCCLDKEAGIPLGNIKSSSLEEILQSDRAKKIKNGFENFTLTEDLCKRCDYITRFDQKTKSPASLSHESSS